MICRTMRSCIQAAGSNGLSAGTPGVSTTPSLTSTGFFAGAGDGGTSTLGTFCLRACGLFAAGFVDLAKALISYEISFAHATAVSLMRVEKPHSLSYQLITDT